MAVYLRDTQLGNLLRFLSRGRLFQYPDELDPSLWRKLVQQKGPLQSGLSDEQQAPSEKSDDTNSAANGTLGDIESHDVKRQSSDASRTGARNRDGYLVGWYGADDLEVRYRFRQRRPLGNLSHMKCRTPKTGPKDINFLSASKSAC